MKRMIRFTRFLAIRQRPFSLKVTVEDQISSANENSPLANPIQAKNTRISELLEIPEVIDYNESPLFKGNLILCPTPIGNLKDMSIRAYEALTTADIIACEDTRVTGKLLTLLKQRKFDVQIRNILNGEYEPETKDELDPSFSLQKDSAEDGDSDESVFAAFAATKQTDVVHKNMYELRRLKKKLKDFHLENDVKVTKDLARTRLQKDDSLSFLGKYETENDGSLIEQEDNRSKLEEAIQNYPFSKNVDLESLRKRLEEAEDDSFYDSSSKSRRKAKAKFEKDPLDDPFIGFMKKKIYESKLKKGRGLLISCHRFNESQRIDNLLRLMKSGFKVVLVPDAGSPCLSDPGQLLVNETIKNKIVIEALPGPNSIALALGVSGFPGDNYSFYGFFPKTEGERFELIDRIKESKTTSVLFENKHRILAMLLFLEKELGPKQKVYVGVELTKLHERNLQGPIDRIYDVINKNPDYTVPSLKGEITVVIAPYTKSYNKDLVEMPNPNEPNPTRERLKDIYSIRPKDLINVLQEYMDVQTKDLAHIVADIINVPKKKAYELVVKEKKNSKAKEEQ